VSHDLWNPLSVARGHVELAEEASEQDSAEFRFLTDGESDPQRSVSDQTQS
jgi:signal transduction histidine kinase